MFRRPVLRLPAVVLALYGLVVAATRPAESATIGDGSVSLITGRAIDFSHQRLACEIDGESYASETAIPRQHPCHFCICFQGKVDCYWKNCPPPPDQCTVLSYENVCEPSLYHCPIPVGLKRNTGITGGKSSPAGSATKSVYFQPQPFPSKRVPQARQAFRQISSNQNSLSRTASSSNRQQQVVRSDRRPVAREATPVKGRERQGSGFKAPRKMEFFGTPFVPSPEIPAGRLAPEGDFFKPMTHSGIPVQRGSSSRSLRFRRGPGPVNRRVGAESSSKIQFRPRRSVNQDSSPSGLSLPGISEPFPVDLMSFDFLENLVSSPSSALSTRVKRSLNATQYIDRGCDILGIRYEVGEVIGVASDLCMECRCAAQALFCSPKCCFEPAKPRLEARFLDQVSLSGPVKYANRPTASHPLQYLIDQYGNA